jgi:SNF2 family DNA or RNA helicase
MSLEAFRDHYYGYGSGVVMKRKLNKKTGYYEYKPEFSNKVRNVPRHLDDLQYRLRKHIMCRRLKEHVLPQLPPKIWHPFPLQSNADIKRALKHEGWKKAERIYEMDQHAFDKSIPVDGAVSTARRLLGEAKAPGIVNYIEDLFIGGVTKLIVAAWHHSVLDFFREQFERIKIDYVYMDGRTSPRKKQWVVDQFQQNEEIQIILGQTKPLGEGWTLTEAQDVILAEFDWTPGKNDQLLDRIHRQGQIGDNLIGHIPIVPGTLDERILATAIDKDKNIYKALDKE